MNSRGNVLRQEFGLGLRERLGDILVRKARISRRQLAQAVRESSAAEMRLGEYLIERGLVYEQDIAQALADQFGLPYVAIEPSSLEPSTLRLLPEHVARRLDAIALRCPGETLTVAVADPTDVLATDELRIVTDRQLELAVSERCSIRAAIDHAYRSIAIRVDLATENDVTLEASDACAIDGDQGPDTAPAIEVVNSILRHGISLSASDVHFVPGKDALIVRARVDGVMRDIDSVPLKLRAAVLSRLKVMGRLDIAEKRLPQDGRVSITLGEVETDLRIAVLPTTWGETVVLRMMYLDSLGTRRSLADLRMDSRTEAVLRHALRQPDGAILLCGPTGSGKTTTLYAALADLNDGQRSLITIEDPVEQVLDGAVQVEVNERAGLTFARGLRTILRADPDVLLVGEIRDHHTAEIAMQAATAGHLVLSSLHSHSAPAALTRLRDIGLSSALVASAASCVVAQRLLRQPCAECGKDTAVPMEEVVAAGLPNDVTLHRPRGCPACGQTGYAGRIAVYESFPVDDSIRDAAHHGSTTDVERAARTAGMRTMRENAIDLCLRGETTLDEVNRVCGDGAVPQDA